MNYPDKKDLSLLRFSTEHIEQVAQIERDTFSEPWSENSLRLLCTEEYPSFVVTNSVGDVLGYLSAQRALDELEIINLAVTADNRGRGIGRLLIEGMKSYCIDNGISLISLEVRASNRPAIGLYEKCGFAQAGVRRNFYRLPTENAVVMIKNLTE